MRTALFLSISAALCAVAGLALAQGSGLSADQRGAAFDAADANKDGKLTREEFANTPRGRAPNDPASTWAASDKDGDGFVSRQEFIAPMTGEGASAPQTPSVAATCAVAGACRHIDGFDITLRNGQKAHVSGVADVPWVSATGAIIMLPNLDGAIFRMEDLGTGLRPILVVGGPAARTAALAPGQIRVMFDQTAEIGSTLKIENRLERPFHYDAIITPLGGNAQPTSICASAPAISNAENWETPLVQVVISGFAYTDRRDCWGGPVTTTLQGPPPPAPPA